MSTVAGRALGHGRGARHGAQPRAGNGLGDSVAGKGSGQAAGTCGPWGWVAGPGDFGHGTGDPAHDWVSGRRAGNGLGHGQATVAGRARRVAWLAGDLADRRAGWAARRAAAAATVWRGGGGRKRLRQ
ncbi:uncharacterized protein LOC130134832 [Syzygium oleosum]|uniref:uncharacterized protein LOC130134832 n=1 Tax=Syzygium oleosum TaxID=219896 RepID=UPI0024BA65E2|nr:uncharacterized protein LOC130134832 [Syzygium oleosum]